MRLEKRAVSRSISKEIKYNVRQLNSGSSGPASPESKKSVNFDIKRRLKHKVIKNIKINL